ncbi:hypothetical protein EPUS_04206 [Endocarpon pusillum Z07020]|uniref:Transcription factor TFIIIB component B'' Myb domain-containing protein n=1 Tax=Endocarpon pusillum (strain Z07020 / HMAS-L-300199) TaxID=1263415 RepID=U1GV48_ENDPU|nr:uncharacterized protein EPUS_04206 [Endocarpon pusillum Z07020]ERF76348.1 hypothetical protein EPUS_04206 [Endocarpon pusillum Z07020]
MPAFSSSINKSGSNKRVAPKAPPRRTIRNATTPSAGSRDDDTISQSQSFPGTPDPQHVQGNAASIVHSQQEPVDNRHSWNSATRLHDGSANTATSESDFPQTVNPLPASTSLRSTRAPTVISTAPQEVPSLADTEPSALIQASVGAVAISEPAQTSRQTRAATKSFQEASRTEAVADTIPSSNNQTTVSPDIISNASRGRRKPGQVVQPVVATKPAIVETAGATRDQALDQVNTGSSKAKVPRQSKLRSERQAPFAVHDGVPDRSQTLENPSAQPGNSTTSKRRSTWKRKQRLSAQEAAEEVIDEATGGVNGDERAVRGRKRKRKLGSEEAESHEIVPSEVMMADLVKDQGLGKTSRREAEMQKIDWLEVKRKRREAEKEALKEEQRQKEARKNGGPLPAPGPHVAERLVLVNGQMVIDESSRMIDRNAETARDAEGVEEAIDEDRLTKRVNQSTVGRKPGTVRTYSTWDDEQTEQFYQGLRMFGTDFMMISKMFPDTSRAVIKKKFNKEEKLNPEKVFAALNSKEPVDLQAFSEITDTTYADPQDFYKELEEEKARLEAEDAKMRAEDAQHDQDIQESIEQADEGASSEGEHPDGEPQARKNRLVAEAQSIVDNAITRKKKSKKTPSARKKKSKKGKGLPAEGTEEIVGSIEDVAP